MRASRSVAIFLAAVVGALSSCGPLDKSHWETGHFSGSKLIAVNLVYGGNASSLALAAYADVADGSAGSVEVTGLQHWRCHGQFRAHQSQRGEFPWDMENLPAFTPPTVKEPTLNFFVPSGSYTVTVRIPAVRAEVKESATLGQGSGPDPISGIFQHDPGCALVADSATQQKALIAQYLEGLGLIVKRLGKADLRTLIEQAQRENAVSAQATSPAELQSGYALVVTTLKGLLAAFRAELPDSTTDLAQPVNDAIALLSQSGLH